MYEDDAKLRIEIIAAIRVMFYLFMYLFRIVSREMMAQTKNDFISFFLIITAWPDRLPFERESFPAYFQEFIWRKVKNRLKNHQFQFSFQIFYSIFF